MGLAELARGRSTVINLDSLGISTDPTSNTQYDEVYKMMLGDNEKFKEMYQSLNEKIKSGTKPLVITEGEADVKHVKKP